MEEKNSKKDVSQLFDDSTDFDIKPSKGKNVIIVILILIIISLCGVIYYLTSNNKAQDNIPKIDNSQNSNQNNETPESTIETLNIDDRLVKELYTYIGGATKEYDAEDKVLNFYQGKKVTIDDLNLDILAQGVLNNQYSKLYDEGKLSYDFLQTLLIKMYNLQQTTKFPDELNYTRAGGGILCTSNECTTDGADSIPTETNGKLIKAEKFEDYIYIYDDYAYIPSLKPGPECIEKRTVYTDSTMSTIAGYINNTLEKIEGSEDDCSVIDSKNEYKLTRYIHTFKKYENSNDYYWISTKPADISVH